MTITAGAAQNTYSTAARHHAQTLRLQTFPVAAAEITNQRLIWPEPTAFMLSHCNHCAFSRRLTLKGGQIARLCGLDNNPILPDIVGCDRYQPRITCMARSQSPP